ncbi:MAG: DUF4430 domain-containing protein [Patescibacteria group bacterium]|jgi:hypothetical protein
MNSTGSNLLKIAGRLLAVVCLVFAGWLIGTGNLFTTNSMITKPVVEQNEAETVSAMFDYGNGTVKTLTDIPVEDTTTVFNVLASLDNNQKIDLSYKDFGGDLGAFIQAIDNVPADSSVTDKWWQFWVNNVYSTTGASTYQIYPGDVIEFKFIQGQLVY